MTHFTTSEFVRYITCGSGRGFHSDMLVWAILKFGKSTKKSPKDFSSWKPTQDQYANELLDCFVGVPYTRNSPERVILRAVLAKELSVYLLTGQKTEGLLEQVKKSEKDYYAAGYGTSVWTLRLPAHQE